MIQRYIDGWRRFWALSWWWKGPTLALVPLIVLGIGLAITLGGNSDTPVLKIAVDPTPTSTVPIPSPTTAASPGPTTTSEAPQVPSPEPTPLAEPAQQAPSAQPPPRESAPERGLTAAEVVECEFGQSDGWDDAFDLRPFGFTPFPASLAATTDPVACESLWLAAYDDGYSGGTSDKCSIVSDYIDVASPEDLAFCGLEAAPTPAPAPIDGELLYELGYNIGYPDGYGDGSVGDDYLTSFYIDPTIGVGSVYYPSGYAAGYADGYSDGEDYFDTIPGGCLPNC